MTEQEGKLVRVGQCNQCGQCCMGLGWFGIEVTPQMQEWLEAWAPGVQIEPYPEALPGQEHARVVMFPYACSQLARGEDGRYGCKLHGTDQKPALCRDWPSTAECGPDGACATEGCGFSWIRLTSSDEGHGYLCTICQTWHEGEPAWEGEEMPASLGLGRMVLCPDCSAKSDRFTCDACGQVVLGKPAHTMMVREGNTGTDPVQAQFCTACCDQAARQAANAEELLDVLEEGEGD